MWRSVEGAISALFVVLAALCAAATVFVLVAPVFPRLLWGLTVACAAAVLVAVLAAICVAKYAPSGDEPRFVAGFLLVIPLWVAAMCWVFLARGAVRAWLACGIAALILGALVWAVPS